MDANKVNSVKEDFLVWSGGFPPDSEQQIFVYMEYALGTDDSEANEVREMLRNWMQHSDNDNIFPFP